MDPKKTWVSNISIAPLFRGPLGFGPIQFLMEILFMFIPIRWRWSHFDEYFFRWVGEKPPTNDFQKKEQVLETSWRGSLSEGLLGDGHDHFIIILARVKSGYHGIKMKKDDPKPDELHFLGGGVQIWILISGCLFIDMGV